MSFKSGFESREKGL